jgi:hypothetical protein
MDAAAFLLIVLLLSVLGSLVLVLRQRTPAGGRDSIDSFRREMDALRPPDRNRTR